MKKIFTLFAGLLMTVAIFAADRRPVVTVKKAVNYKVVIDGRTYYDNDLTMRLGNLGYGRHTIQVFEMRRGGIFSRERMLSAATFKIERDDLNIKIDRYGKIQIREKNRRFDDDRDWNDRDWNDHDNRDRDYRKNDNRF
jgi:hypothetical protein